ncbi:MAG: type I 3-dehydroquinate dehydratase [Acidobacteria bacterium]|nr:type I 3-dehydroquinate dehydratase [Acidobacteriota bacterium]
MQEAILIATLTTASDLEGQASLEGVAWLEVRADLAGDLEISWLRERFPGKVLYTLRSTQEGGSFTGGKERRAERLIAAAESGFDLVDLEAERDLRPDVLEKIPGERRVLSWHGSATDATGLRRRFDAMAKTPAVLYKLIPSAGPSDQTLAPLLFLHQLRRQDAIAFATGETSTWSRLVAPHLGAPVVYGALGEPGAAGQLSIERLRRDFGYPELSRVAALFGVVGDPVSHSLSPRLHNTGYRKLGLPALYLPFQAESFGDFWLEVVESEVLANLGLPLKGLSVTAPFKRVALAVAGASSPLAERIGAANTLVLNGGVWEAEATDPEGVVAPLEAAGLDLEGKSAAVLGCGGAGRSAAAGLVYRGAKVSLFNRTRERGRQTGYDLGLPVFGLEELDPSEFQVVVHATALGHRPDDPLPFEPLSLEDGAVVVDMVYGEEPTPLVHACRQAGKKAIDGREVLLAQGRRQFEMMTGRQLPDDAAHEALGI